jgi:hypothetical protein
MLKPAKKRARKTIAAKTAANPSSPRPKTISTNKLTAIDKKDSKQSRVLEMLRSSTGTTIDAVMKATGWQQHSVRGFFAGVVRKKLDLKLNSEKVDGIRTYRVVGGSGASATSRSQSGA